MASQWILGLWVLEEGEKAQSWRARRLRMSQDYPSPPWFWILLFDKNEIVLGAGGRMERLLNAC